MKIQYKPSILYFGMPLGLIGTALNSQHLMQLLQLHNDVALGMLFYGWLSFLLIGAHYIMHLMAGQGADLIAEWEEPFKRAFFPVITLSLLLLIMSLWQVIGPVGMFLQSYQAWLVSAYTLVVLLHFILNILFINGWLMTPTGSIETQTPTWFVLLSGNFVVVIVGNSLIDVARQPLWLEVFWLFFATGLFFWLTFAVSLVNRLLFASPLVTALRPSLFIFLAPPSLGCIASILLFDNGLSLLGWGLYGFATVMLMVWVVSHRYFIQSGLSMSGWAYVYPLAAYGLASQYLSEVLHSQLLLIWSLFILGCVLVLIILLTAWLIKKSFTR